MRISEPSNLPLHGRVFLPLLLLAACSQAAEPPPTGDPIACALDGATEFTGDCRSESRIVAGGTIMTIRHPDGGFRRLEIEGDLVRTADGAETPTVTIEADATVVTVGIDRYRLPPPAPPVDTRRP